MLEVSINMIFNASLELYHTLDFHLINLNSDFETTVNRVKKSWHYFDKNAGFAFLRIWNKTLFWKELTELKTQCIIQFQGGIIYQIYWQLYQLSYMYPKRNHNLLPNIALAILFNHTSVIKGHWIHSIPSQLYHHIVV